MKLKYEQVIPLRVAINKLNEIDNELRRPIYSLTEKFSKFIGRVSARIRPHEKQIDTVRAGIMEKVRPELSTLTQEQVLNPMRKKSDMEIDADKQWEKFMGSMVDIDVQPFKGSLIEKDGVIPTPETMEALDPLLED